LNTYRLREFVNPADGHSLIVDTSVGLVLGVQPGLEHLGEAVGPILPLVDGVVTSPGQARHLAGRTRQDAALLVRADWSNALRGEDFVLPPETVHYARLVDAAGALDVGASAAVIHFLLGYAEAIEAECLKHTVQLALDGADKGLPLIVDVQPTGSRVVLRGKAIELGVSYAMEGGASGVVIPWPGADSFRTILTMAGDLPVWLAPDGPDPDQPDVRAALELGAAGIWLDERLFAAPDPAAVAARFRALVHAPVAESA
jgi:DhnA family fructose-bisphosphate aldolase class Ia